MTRPRFLPDNFTLSLVAVVALASFLPCSGQTAVVFDWITDVAIGLLFFLHGAKLSREAIVAGITHWRLHLLIFAFTFVMFPVLGLALKPLLAPLVSGDLYLGILFLCALPATVQSAIALTSIARGNIPAAICSASASSLLGIFLTPVLVKLMMSTSGQAGVSFDAVGRIMVQLLLPFVLGHALRPWIGGWVARRRAVLKYVDQGSILLVVYSAFSEAVVGGLWRQTSAATLAGLLGACAVILALALLATTWISRALGFSKEDEITIVFCGSKKSLASGIPMAKVLLSSSTAGAIVLPLMVFHQMQLMVCAVLARRYASRPETVPEARPRAA